MGSHTRAAHGGTYIPNRDWDQTKAAEWRASMAPYVGRRVLVQYRGARGRSDVIGCLASLGRTKATVVTDLGREHHVDLASLLHAQPKEWTNHDQGKPKSQPAA